MNAENFIRNLQGAIDKTAEDMLPVMEQAALSAKALLARRIQNSGFNRRYTSRSYISLRKRKGFETRFINLTFSGQMFQGWKVPGHYRQGLKIIGTIGGADMSTRNKLKWNKSRFPMFDQINSEEKSLIASSFIAPRLKEILQKNINR